MTFQNKCVCYLGTNDSQSNNTTQNYISNHSEHEHDNNEIKTDENLNHIWSGNRIGQVNTDFDLPSLNEPVTNTKLITGRNGSVYTTNVAIPTITAIQTDVSRNNTVTVKKGIDFYLFR